MGRWLQRRIGDPRNNRKWKVITLVRDPVSRNVSSFFQNLEFHLSYDYRSKVQYESRETMVADIRRLFEEHYLDREAMEQIDTSPLTWFDSELKAVFDVDVYASEFPREQGYQIYESEKASVLLLRLEDLNRNHLTALKGFLRIKDFTLVTKNTAEGQAYVGTVRRVPSRFDAAAGVRRRTLRIEVRAAFLFGRGTARLSQQVENARAFHAGPVPAAEREGRIERGRLLIRSTSRNYLPVPTFPSFSARRYQSTVR